jgi:hypothetical protein
VDRFVGGKRSVLHTHGCSHALMNSPRRGVNIDLLFVITLNVLSILLDPAISLSLRLHYACSAAHSLSPFLANCITEIYLRSVFLYLALLVRRNL